MSRPWMKFYPVNWRADPRLRMCSLAARGLWIDLISYMHEGEPYGHLTIDGAKPDINDIAALIGRPVAEVRRALDELESRQVFSRDEGGVIYSRRMVRDKARAEQDSKNGKGGGNPKLKPADNGGVNPPDKTQRLETRDQKVSEPNGSGAEPAPPEDPRTRLFNEGLTKLATITGRGPDACRSLLGKWLKATQDEAIDVLAAIEDAERERVANPVPWINQRLTAIAGRPARPAPKPVAGVVIRFDSPQARAWERHNGKSFAWGQRLQRTVPTEWPPGHDPPRQEATVADVADALSQMSRGSA